MRFEDHAVPIYFVSQVASERKKPKNSCSSLSTVKKQNVFHSYVSANLATFVGIPVVYLWKHATHRNQRLLTTTLIPSSFTRWQ
ncbi:hypothetical protein ANCCAN_01137 [Ancylostoma caninum]|uniref:Uncharacterized protein n=1 Tax=Ancylostoma caninum TaxID=29170 RepID=A0A368HBK1_ANCCA|nr:hypothetical protein ANCCAN_01137 [Ancylostoma caninum]